MDLIQNQNPLLFHQGLLLLLLLLADFFFLFFYRFDDFFFVDVLSQPLGQVAPEYQAVDAGVLAERPQDQNLGLFGLNSFSQQLRVPHQINDFEEVFGNHKPVNHSQDFFVRYAQGHLVRKLF